MREAAAKRRLFLPHALRQMAQQSLESNFFDHQPDRRTDRDFDEPAGHLAILVEITANAVFREPEKIEPREAPKADPGGRHLIRLLATHAGSSLVTADHELRRALREFSAVLSPADFIRLLVTGADPHARSQIPTVSSLPEVAPSIDSPASHHLARNASGGTR